MCGICGIIDRTVSDPDGLASVVARMTTTLAHRGPDSHGIWTDPAEGIALGHRRLAIVDLSAAGHQPMLSSTGRYVITYNGEIYNFADLRRALEAKGRRFRGGSDTEVLLEAIEEWGVEAALRRSVGMFALALYDRAERTLCLARDRLGIKPLYWASFGDLFLFGSELKALLAHNGWPKRVRRSSLVAYFQKNFIPAPLSIFEGVNKLPPGHVLWRSGSGEIQVHPFWDLRQVATAGLRSPFEGSDGEAVDALENLLRQAVGCRMIADVPLGAFLSGGIDSSTVVALMQAQSNRPVKTFSIGFKESDFNEAHYAKAVASHLGTDHVELYVDPVLARSLIPSLPHWFDEPFSDSSQIPTLLVSQLARQNVTVALSGDGGDEAFGGYTRYDLTQRVWNIVGRVPLRARPLASRFLRALTPANWDRLLSMMPLSDAVTGHRLHRLAELITSTSPRSLYDVLNAHWTHPEQLVIDGSNPPHDLSHPELQSDRPGMLELMQFIDMMTYLPDDILTKVDRATMSVGLEGRVPLLDHRVVEFSWTLPTSMKVRNGKAKWILRQVLDRYVPQHLVDRSKMGFGIPLNDWLDGPLREWAEDLLSPDSLKRDGFLNADVVAEKWRRHRTGEHKNPFLIWDVLMFQSWRHRWLN